MHTTRFRLVTAFAAVGLYAATIAACSGGGGTMPAATVRMQWLTVLLVLLLLADMAWKPWA